MSDKQMINLLRMGLSVDATPSSHEDGGEGAAATATTKQIRFARLGHSGGFAYLNPFGRCRVIPSSCTGKPQARHGMHVMITFWSRQAEPIFEVGAQSLN